MKLFIQQFWVGILSTIAGSLVVSKLSTLSDKYKKGVPVWLFVIGCSLAYIVGLLTKRTTILATSPKPKIRTLGYLKFDYLPQKPMDQGWDLRVETKPPNEKSLPPDCLSAIKPPTPGSIEIKDNGIYYMDYSIEPINSFANLVEFCIKPTKSSRFYLSIELSSRDKKYRKTRWLKYVVGEGQPEPLINKITNEITEWTIYKEGEPLEDGWTRLKLQLHEDVESTFGREGFVYQSVKRIRLRGSMCLSPITFYKIE